MATPENRVQVDVYLAERKALEGIIAEKEANLETTKTESRVLLNKVAKYFQSNQYKVIASADLIVNEESDVEICQITASMCKRGLSPGKGIMNYCHRSFSFGDLLVLCREDGDLQYYYYDASGWKLLNSFLKTNGR